MDIHMEKNEKIRLLFCFSTYTEINSKQTKM